MARTTCSIAILLAAAVLAACAGAPPPAGQAAVPLARFEAQPLAVAPAPGAACGVEGAPPRPAAYDERAFADLLTWAWGEAPFETYCGCRFGADQKVQPDCPYAPPDATIPAVRWEPVVPPSRFGVYRRCWQQWSTSKGDDPIARQQCARVDEEFREMEADLYNFHPVIAELSAQRGDNPFANVHGEPRDFGACDFESQSDMGKKRKIEPPADVRGDLARVYLYMAARYGKGSDWKIKLPREQRQLYEKWAEADPVDERERARACRIAAIQGWTNPYVK
jgi:deoxyribonuclease-1